MSFFGFWHEGWTAALVNHLWQSTAVVVVAWVLAAALRKNHARVRYWIWFAASMKFLLPFSLLIAAGEWLRSLVPVPAAQPAVASVVEQLTQPFGQTQFFEAGSAPIAAHHASLWPAVLVAVWLCGAFAIAIRFGLAWAKMNAVKRGARPSALAADVPVLSSSTPIEPGIFGVFRPVLLLPEGIPELLSAEQMRAVVAHEMCHVRRRDNLTFAVHMVVETLFWFHPLVWWIGSRLIEEREHACDEAAVENGMSADIFAEGLLRVCRFCVESKLICVSCVTGADLKRRVQQIMSSQRKQLSWSRKLAIGLLTSMLVMGSVALGVMKVPVYLQLLHAKGPRPAFEVATIKPSKPDEATQMMGIMWNPRTGFLTGTHVPLRNLIRFAYQLRRDDQLISLPGWAGKEYFDIHARADTSETESMRKMRVNDSMDQFSLMLQSLLAERFHLAVSTTTRELPVYALVVARNGPKLKEVSVPPGLYTDNRFPPPPPPPPPPSRGSAPPTPLPALGPPLPGVWQTGAHQVTATACRMSWFVGWLMGDSELSDRAVVDRTGLSGNYDFVLKGIAINHPSHPGIASAAPEEFTVSIFTALKQQLGLQLVSQKAPVEVLVVDHVERPSPN